MRIGISLLNLRRDMGGQYQYALMFTQALTRSDHMNEYVVFHDSPDFSASDFKEAPKLEMVFVKDRDSKGYRARGLLRLAYVLGLGINSSFMRGKYDAMRQARLDLLVQPSPGAGAFFAGLPFIFSVHDLIHKDFFRPGGLFGYLIWELRLKASMRAAHAVLVDSRRFKTRLISEYGLNPDRIHVAPFRPPDYLESKVNNDQLDRVRSKYHLPGRYIFYPSNLCFPKNHLGLLKSLKHLSDEKGFIANLVLVGPRDDAFEMVMTFIQEHGLQKQVKYLGYVPDGDMAPLYKLATALIFPSLLDPTCIPVIEAFSLGCPVICSRLPGFAEQVGDAGILINTQAPSEIAEAIFVMFNNTSLRETLIQRGYQQWQQLSNKNYGEQLYNIICEVSPKLSLDCPII